MHPSSTIHHQIMSIFTVERMGLETHLEQLLVVENVSKSDE